MDDPYLKKSSDTGDESNKDSGSGETISNTKLNTLIIPQQPTTMISHLLPFQYPPDLAYSAYLLGYTGSLMAATRQYLPQAVFPSFGTLSTPNFLQQQPITMDLNPLITDVKPSELKGELSSTDPQNHSVKISHELSSQDQGKTIDHQTTPIVTISNNDLFSFFHPLTVTSSSDPDLLSSMIPKTSSHSDMTRVSTAGGDKYLTREEKMKMNRDRNREHARSTRLRKKAYVSKLKELVDGLHVELSEDARKRRVASQHVAELQRVRRSVILSFLKFLANNNKTDDKKLSTFVEENFILKQPVTPYRWFRQNEIDGECRRTMGIDGTKEEAASISVMVENIGSRCARWKQIKREEFLSKEVSLARKHRSRFPHSIVRQNSCLQHAISSLSSSGSYKESSETTNSDKRDNCDPMKHSGQRSDQVSSLKGQDANYFHDYDAKPLPDPKLLESSAYDTSESGTGSDNAMGDKNVCTDSSSGEEEKQPISKRRKHSLLLSKDIIFSKDSPQKRIIDESFTNQSSNVDAKQPYPSQELTSHPMKCEKSEQRMKVAPAIKLPPFGGIGKKRALANTVGNGGGEMQQEKLPAIDTNNTSIASVSCDPSNQDSLLSIGKKSGDKSASNIIGDNESSSSHSSTTHVQAYYHINEDDMIITGDVLMCPFIFRSQDAVLCGALADCVMPGMLRAQFSSRNKIVHMEMAYDAMGFMQQLERASGNEGTAQIVPNSLEMTLQPTHAEARIITLAKHPYLVVSVNEAWTTMTSFTQLDVEGKEYQIFYSKRFDHDFGTKKTGKPIHDMMDVAKGFPACSVNAYRDKHYKDIIVHVSSYPLCSGRDEVTYLLHVWTLLPELDPTKIEVLQSF